MIIKILEVIGVMLLIYFAMFAGAMSGLFARRYSKKELQNQEECKSILILIDMLIPKLQKPQARELRIIKSEFCKCIGYISSKNF